MPIIAMTGSCDRQTVRNVVALGIEGIVSKSEDAEIIEVAVSTVLKGGVFLHKETVAMSELIRSSQSSDISGKNNIDRQMRSNLLTTRQMRVVQLVSIGNSNKEIARQLKVSPSTVKFHIDGILERLKAKNRVEAVLKFLIHQNQKFS